MCDLNYFFRSPGEQDCWSFWHSWMLDYDTEAIVDSQKENNLFFLQICFGSKGKIWDRFVTSSSSPFLFPVSSKWAGENLSETLLKDSQGGALPSAAAGLGSTGHRGQTVERDYRERRTEGRRGGHPLPSPGPSCATDRFPAVLCAGMSFTNHDCFVGWVSRPPSVPSNMADASWVPKSWGMKEWWKFLGRHFCYIFLNSILAKVDNIC